MKKKLFVILLLLGNFYSIFAKELILSKPDASSFPDIKSALIIRGDDNIVIEDINVDDFILKENSKIIDKNLIALDCFSNNAPFELLMIVDISSSMNELVEDEPKIEWVRQSMRIFVNKLDLGQFSSVAITAFCTDSKLKQNFTNDKSKLISAINNITAVQASTNMNVAFLEEKTGAIDLLKKRVDINRIIVFLTDGQHDASNYGAFQTSKILNLLKTYHIKLFAITFMDYSNIQLVNLANNSGGNYYLVKDPESLSNIYSTINNGVSNEKFCTLKWKSNVFCNNIPRYTNIDLQYKPLNLYTSNNYTTPEWSVFDLEFDKGLYYFGNIAPDENSIISIKFTPTPWDYDISKIYLENTKYFQIIDYGFGIGIQPPDNFIIKTGESHTIKVKFTQKNNYNARTVKLIIDAEPCDKIITLYGGKGAIIIDSPIKNSIHSACEKIEIAWSGVAKDTETELYYKPINDNSWKLITKKAQNLSYYWTPPLVEGKYQIKAIAELNTGSADISEAISDTFQIAFPKINIIEDELDMQDVLLGSSNILSFKHIVSNNDAINTNEITYSVLGNHADDFEILSINPNQLTNNDSLDIEIKFTPKNSGNRQAVLYLKPDCGKEVKIDLKGNGLCSLIAIDTIGFTVQYVDVYKDSLIKQCLYNPMDIPVKYDLYITGPNKNTFSVKAYSGQIFSIAPLSYKDITVYFNPDNNKNKVGFLNYNIHGCNNIKTTLKGSGIYRGIETAPLNFGRKLFKSKFDTLSLQIKNLDLIEKNVVSIELLSNNDIFKILDLDSSNILLERQSIFRRVVYTPKKIGLDTAIIRIIDDFGDTLNTFCTGAVFLPQIKFDVVCPSEFSDKGEGLSLVEIINNGNEPVLIDTCYLLSDNNEFYWQSKIPQDTIIEINDTLKYNIIYKPETSKSHKANIVLWANNFDADYDSTFIDNSINLACESIEFTYTQAFFGNSIICGSQISSFNINNLSENIMMKVFFDNMIKTGSDINAFEILNIKDTMLIKGGATPKLNIRFTSQHIGKHSAKFIIPTSENEDITLILNAYAEEITHVILPKNKSYKQKEIFKAIYSIHTPNVIENITEINIDLLYNIDDLHLEKGKLTTLITSDNTKKTYLIFDTLRDNFGNISIRAKGRLLANKEYDILQMEFMGLFSESDSTLITGELKYPCYTNKEELAVWKSDYFCLKEMRDIIGNGMDFEFTNVIPNPTNGQFNLKFQIPYDLKMKISIYTIAGAEIKILFDENIKAGSYDKYFELSDLAANAYFISYEYGKNRKVYKFIKSD